MVKMSEDSWKLEKDLCRCCHSEGAFKNLSETCPDDGLEVYSDMLQFALNINMSPVAGVLCFVTYTICEQCIDRLRDAVNFKRQVQQCEDRFRDMYDRDIIKVGDSNVKLKQESPELDAEVADKNTDFPHMDTDDSDDFPLNYEADNRSETDVKKEVISKSKSKKTKPKQTKSKKKTEQTKKNESGDAGKKVPNISLEDVTDYTVINEGDKRKYSCNECCSILTSAYNIKKHIWIRHLNIMKYKCPLCDAKFKHHDTKTQHLAMKHGMEEVKVGTSKVIKEVETCICEVCKKEFPGKGSLTRHMYYHRPIKCKLCHVAVTKHKMLAHKSTVHGVPLHTCGVCGYKNKRKRLLLVHQRKVHMKEKNLACNYCDAMFFDNIALKRHMVRHNPVKRFECSHCTKKFARMNTLKQHEKIHTGDKRKVCTICDERFVQKASLNYHMVKHHPEAC
ncbi:zinc finger protein 708-like isoform X1 [Achroia grisella]|uniref:zinc finger protein 708-like isoform X1 n=1 Tax=Achroia grisella TaxID=688607 RepID=UPI0027D211D8|nr:zinc finger protein 708-like isoform X1 [Achroia grisella]